MLLFCCCYWVGLFLKSKGTGRRPRRPRYYEGTHSDGSDAARPQPPRPPPRISKPAKRLHVILPQTQSTSKKTIRSFPTTHHRAPNPNRNPNQRPPAHAHTRPPQSRRRRGGLLLAAAVVAEVPARDVQRGAAGEAHGGVELRGGQHLDVVAQRAGLCRAGRGGMCVWCWSSCARRRPDAYRQNRRPPTHTLWMTRHLTQAPRCLPLRITTSFIPQGRPPVASPLPFPKSCRLID